MKKLLLSVLMFIISCFLLGSPGYAGSRDHGHSFKISLDSGYHEYNEPGVMEETGMLTGVVGSYMYHADNGLMADASLRVSYGVLEYDGGTWGGTPLKLDAFNTVVELRGLVGYDLEFKGNCFITPFVGLGYRYLNNDKNYTGAYEREIEYLYVPIGVSTNSPLADGWRWGINMEYDLFLGGRVYSYLSEANSDYNDSKNDQGFMEGYGARASLHFEKKISEKLSLSIEPFVRYWDIKDSDLSLVSTTPRLLYGYEPKNDTTTYGLRIGLIL